jgi:hypothetical protein
MTKSASNCPMPWAPSEVPRLASMAGPRERSQLAVSSKEGGSKWE